MSFFGIIYIITTTLILIFKKETENKDEQEPEQDQLSLLDSYKTVFKIFSLMPIRKLAFLLFTIRVN